MNKYLEVKQSDPIEKKNARFSHCQQASIPYVVVTTHGNTASVEWDYITSPIGAEKLFEKKEVFLRAELMKIYDKYATKNSTFSVSASSASFSKFSTQNAKAAADEIFDLVDNVIKNKAC